MKLNSTLFSVASDDSRDHDWEPQLDSDSDSDVSKSCIEENDSFREQKYIVFESCLDDLLCQCVICSPKTTVSKRSLGTLLVCEIICETCGYSNSWKSQPMSGNMPLGNLVFSTAIMFSGGSVTKVLRALDFACIKSFSFSTFHSIQSHTRYLNTLNTDRYHELGYRGK